MISTRLHGRLGNQLFVYATARAMSEKYNQIVLIYDRTDEKNDFFHSHLSGYHLNNNIIFTNNEHKVKGYNIFRNLYFISHVLKTIKKTPREVHDIQVSFMEKNIKHGLFLMTDGYYPLPESVNRDMFFDGYFQSPKYFDFVRGKLINELKPKDEHTTSEKKMIKEIEETESVCLTIRLGDYLNNPTHQVCSVEYYMKAIQMMKELVPNCKFFVFSDDIDMVKQIFEFDENVIFDDGKSKDYMSLDVMSHCKHFIISNSSFSWWAQYLSINEGKIVISPSKWYAKDVPCDVMQEDWILINC